MRSISWMLAAFMVSLLTWAPAAAQGTKPARPVLDDANLFSKKAEDEANATIARIKKESHKDFFVETVLAVPLPKEVNPKDEAAVDEFVNHWAIERFKTFEIDGVYLLITKNPAKLRIEIGPTTLKERWFTAENRTHLKKILKEHLGSEPDKTLVVAAKYVEETMAKHGRPAGVVTNPKTNVQHQPVHQPQQQADGFPTWLIWVGVGLGALLIFWLIMGLARAATGGGGGYGGAPGMGGGGGGGFMSSMLGGLFGAAAGMYLYNNFFGGHGSSAHAGDSYSGAGDSPQESTDVGAGDPSGDGADWGDGGGGADVGGGGDWGGGDAGGGGDWGGGGGGDWGGGGGGDW